MTAGLLCSLDGRSVSVAQSSATVPPARAHERQTHTMPDHVDKDVSFSPLPVPKMQKLRRLQCGCWLLAVGC